MTYFKASAVACCIFLVCAVTVTIILHQYNLRFMGGINSSSGTNNGNLGNNISNNDSEEDNTATEAPMFTVEAVGELSAETKAEIEKAWLDYASNKHMDEIELKLEWCQEDDHYLKARYYGTFDEGVVFFKETTACSASSSSAGSGEGVLSDYEFRNPKRFDIYIYKNGEIQLINSQIEYLDEEDIEEIWNIHKEYQKYLYPEYYEEYYSKDSEISTP